MITTIQAGGLIVKDPDASEVYLMDWDTEHLASGVTLTSSEWTITRISGASTDLMTYDSDSIVDGIRNTQLRLLGGKNWQKYRVTNRVVTNENPSRTKDASFFVLIQEQ